MFKPILGASTLLDRQTHKRADAAYLEVLLAAPAARFLVLADLVHFLRQGVAQELVVRLGGQHGLDLLATGGHGGIVGTTGEAGTPRHVRACVEGPVFRGDRVRWADLRAAAR